MQTSFSELNQLFIDENVTDARFQRVADSDFFQIDLPLRYRIGKYDDLAGLQSKKRLVSEIMAGAAAAGEKSTSLALSRLPREKLAAFRGNHPELKGNPEPNLPLMVVYRQQAEKALKKEQDRIRAMETEADLDRYWSAFVEGIEESIMTRDRLKRELKTFYAVPFIKLWIAYHEATDKRGPVAPDFASAEIYSPGLIHDRPVGISPGDWKLVQENSPVIVHEVNPNAAYPIENDRFGTVSLRGGELDDATPVVDTATPVVYFYIDEKKIHESRVKQLVYTIIHPAHPQLSKLDPEAGIIDGWTIRITLDHENRPLVFESVSNCGCYYKIFPSARLEQSGQEAFAKKLQDKKFFVENSVEGRYDAIVPELVKGISEARPANAVVYFSAGHHQLITIRSWQHAELLEKGFREKTYILHPYDELENLPFNGHQASLFDTDGLVRKAHRPECKLLKPSGLYHAGHPRQRETQMIYFDEAQFDDPGLLLTYLRLPPHVFGQTE